MRKNRKHNASFKNFNMKLYTLFKQLQREIHIYSNQTPIKVLSTYNRKISGNKIRICMYVPGQIIKTVQQKSQSKYPSAACL